MCSKKHALRLLNSNEYSNRMILTNPHSAISLVNPNPLAESTLLQTSIKFRSTYSDATNLALSPIPARDKALRHKQGTTKREHLEKVMALKAARWYRADMQKSRQIEDLSKFNCSVIVNEEGCDPERVSEIGTNNCVQTENNAAPKRRELLMSRKAPSPINNDPIKLPQAMRAHRGVSVKKKGSHQNPNRDMLSQETIVVARETDDTPPNSNLNNTIRVQSANDNTKVFCHLIGRNQIVGLSSTSSHPVNKIAHCRKLDGEYENQFVLVNDLVHACGTENMAKNHLMDGAYKLVIIKPNSQRTLKTFSSGQCVCVIKGKGVLTINQTVFNFTPHGQLMIPPRSRVTIRNVDLGDLVILKAT